MPQNPKPQAPDAFAHLPHWSRLPEKAWADNPDESPDAPPVMELRRGESGYWPVFAPQRAADLNAAAGVTPAQAEAMLAGSMFGWDVPGADPAYYEGRLKS